MSKYLAISALIGALVPCFFIVLNQTSAQQNSTSMTIFGLQLGLWPSSIMLMGLAGRSALSTATLATYALSIFVNIGIYTGLGWCVWFGLNHQRVVLWLVGVAILGMWFLLWRL